MNAMVSSLILGFTGTQAGMNELQKARLQRHLSRWAKEYESLEIHHGDCVGADEDFHNLCLKFWPHSLQVILHPPTQNAKRAFCTSPGQIDLEPLPYLERNHAIVDASSGMVAAPKTMKEELRSGTWATIRYSRKKLKPLILLNSAPAK